MMELLNYTQRMTTETSIYSYFEENNSTLEVPIYISKENATTLTSSDDNLLTTNSSPVSLFSSLVYNISDSINYDGIDAYDTDQENLLPTVSNVIEDIVKIGKHVSRVPTISDHPVSFPSTTSSYLSSIIPDTLNINNETGSYLTVRNVSSFKCLSQHVPSVPEYFAAINVVGVTIFTLGALAVLFILYMYIDTLKHVMKNSPAPVKTHSAFVLSVYTVVALTTYCAIVVPRAHLLAEAMTQGMFMASLYQLFCLFVAYCGGEAELIRKVKPESIILKVPPCCCWPCCFFLPLFPLNKRNVRLLRLLVLQLPVVQGLVYMVLLVMWAEGESLYQVNYMYMQPVIIISILCGIWGMIMTMTVLEDALKDYLMKGKFFVLQMVLLLAKFQALLARIAVWSNIFPCKEPITPPVYANLIYNSLMLLEMIILGAIARRLYKRPINELAELSKQQFPMHICTVIPCNHSINNFYTERNNNSAVVRF